MTHVNNRNEMSKASPTRARSLVSQVIALRQQGLSLRQIASKLKISHQKAKRILDEDAGATQNLYRWGEGEALTRAQIQRRLRKTAKGEKWDFSASALAKWEEQILDAVTGARPASLHQIGYWLATGPSRPGRKLEKDRYILRDETLGKEIKCVFGEMYRDDDGYDADDPIDFHEAYGIYSEDADPQFIRPTSTKPRVPPGTTPQECPRCSRMTLYQEPPFRVLEDDGGWRWCSPPVRYRSKRCKAGTCSSKNRT